MIPISLEQLETSVRGTTDVHLQAAMRRDAALASNIARELEYVYTQLILQEHPDKPFAEGQIIPIDTRPGPGAETYVYYEMGGTAIAVVLNTYADSELPEVGLFARKHIGNIESMGNAWGYNVQDLQAAAISPTTGNLLTEKPRLAKIGHLQAWNDKGLFGDSEYDWNGFLNHPNVPQIAAGATKWNGPFTDQNDIDDVLNDVDALINVPVDLTNNMHKPNRLLVPLRVFTKWRFQRYAFTATSDKTMLQYLETAHPDVDIGFLLECDSAKSGGATSVSRAIAYTGGNQDIVALVRPMDYTQHEGQWHGLRFKVPTQSRFGGTKWSQPLTAAVATGIL